MINAKTRINGKKIKAKIKLAVLIAAAKNVINSKIAPSTKITANLNIYFLSCGINPTNNLYRPININAEPVIVKLIVKIKIPDIIKFENSSSVNILPGKKVNKNITVRIKPIVSSEIPEI